MVSRVSSEYSIGRTSQAQHYGAVSHLKLHLLPFPTSNELYWIPTQQNELSDVMDAAPKSPNLTDFTILSPTGVEILIKVDSLFTTSGRIMDGSGSSVADSQFQYDLPTLKVCSTTYRPKDHQFSTEPQESPPDFQIYRWRIKHLNEIMEGYHGPEKV